MLSEEWIERLITRFEEIYGKSFNNAMVNTTNRLIFKTTFANGLDGLTNAEIKRGLLTCKNVHPNVVPNVIEFFHWCKGLKYYKPAKDYKWKRKS